MEDLSSMLGMIARDGFVNIEPSPAEKTASSESEPMEEDYESKLFYKQNKSLLSFL